MTDIADHAEVVRQQLLHLGPLRGAVGQESLDVLADGSPWESVGQQVEALREEGSLK